MNPLVSVFCFCRNSSLTIGRAVESVLSQTYPNIEFVVQDGQSTDGTIEILRSYGKRIELISEPDGGPADAFWRALKRCKGDIVGSCLSDEELLPDAVAWAVGIHETHSGAGAIYGDVYITDKNGKIQSTVEGPDPFCLLDYLAAKSTPNFAATFFKRTALERIGLYSRKWAMDCGEFELWTRLALSNSIRHEGKCVAKYAVRGDSLSSNPANAGLLCRGRRAFINSLHSENRNVFRNRRVKNSCILSTYLVFSNHLRAVGHTRAAIDLLMEGASALLREGSPINASKALVLAMKESIKDASKKSDSSPQQVLREFWSSLNARDYDSAYAKASDLSSVLSRLSSTIVSVPHFVLVYRYLKNCSPGKRSETSPQTEADNKVILQLRSLFHEHRNRHVSAFKDRPILYKTWFSQRGLDKDSIWGLLKHFGYHTIAVFGGAPLGRSIYRDLIEAGFLVPALVDSHYEGYIADFPELPWRGIDYLSKDCNSVDLILLSIEGLHDLKLQEQLASSYDIRIPMLNWKDFAAIYYDRSEFSDFISPPQARASAP